METTDYCSYELSKQLKACGFDEKCYRVYMRDRQSDTWKLTKWMMEERDYNKQTRPILVISAPTLAHAQKWLREIKNILVNTIPVLLPETKEDEYCLKPAWTFIIWQDLIEITDGNHKKGELKIRLFDSYEQALSAGIAAALELIKKGEMTCR